MPAGQYASKSTGYDLIKAIGKRLNERFGMPYADSWQRIKTHYLENGAVDYVSFELASFSVVKAKLMKAELSKLSVSNFFIR